MNRAGFLRRELKPDRQLGPLRLRGFELLAMKLVFFKALDVGVTQISNLVRAQNRLLKCLWQRGRRVVATRAESAPIRARGARERHAVVPQ